jgi:hypothetical protein
VLFRENFLPFGLRNLSYVNGKRHLGAVAACLHASGYAGG